MDAIEENIVLKTETDEEDKIIGFVCVSDTRDGHGMNRDFKPIATAEMDNADNYAKKQDGITSLELSNYDGSWQNITIKTENSGEELQIDAEDSWQHVAVKTETDIHQTINAGFECRHEILPNVDIKTESNMQISDSDQLSTTCKASSEVTTTCPSCKACFGDYLQYLDHRLVCLAVELPVDKIKTEMDTLDATYTEVKTEMDTLDATYTEVKTEMDTLDATYTEVKTEMETLDTTYAELKPEMDTLCAAYAEHIVANNEKTKEIKEVAEHNIASKQKMPFPLSPQLLIQNKELHKETLAAAPQLLLQNKVLHKKTLVPVPQFLIQNTALEPEVPSTLSEIPAQKTILNTETSITNTQKEVKCPYCGKVFLPGELVRISSFVHHLQVHLNMLNKLIKHNRYVVSEGFKILNEFLTETFANHSDRVTAIICEKRNCNFMFVEKSAAEKHELRVHCNFAYVCSKPDCIKVFPNKGFLRSHEIADHASIVDIDLMRPITRKRKTYEVPIQANTETRAKLRAIVGPRVSTNDTASENEEIQKLTHTCRVCGKTFLTSAELTSHKICGHANMTPKQIECYSGPPKAVDNERHGDESLECKHEPCPIEQTHEQQKKRMKDSNKDFDGTDTIVRNTKGDSECSPTAYCNKVHDICKVQVKEKTEGTELNTKSHRRKNMQKRSTTKILNEKRTRPSDSIEDDRRQEMKQLNSTFDHVKVEKKLEENNETKLQTANHKNESEVEIIPSQSVPHLFPCQSAGCKRVFDSKCERRKHVEDQHMAFHPSLVNFICINPGCFKGFYRKFDLQEHSRKCTKNADIAASFLSNESHNIPESRTKFFNSLSKLNKYVISLKDKLTADELTVIEEADLAAHTEENNVSGNIPEMFWYICPLRNCSYGSRKKTDIYTHLKCKHV